MPTDSATADTGPLSIIHEIDTGPTAPAVEPPKEIILLPKKATTVRDKSKKIVKEIYPLILKRTEGNYRLIGRTIRMLYRVYLHHTQEKLKEPLTLNNNALGAEKHIEIPTPNEAQSTCIQE